MHRVELPRRPIPGGFPRRRGDAPDSHQLRPVTVRFPPQARGCTHRQGTLIPLPRVSPAGAGMHLALLPILPPGARFPRRRGDAPSSSSASRVRRRFPPQARGCTAKGISGPTGGGVSPAGAGMHLPLVALPAVSLGFPRRRGDAPPEDVRWDFLLLFPPQARGCTLATEDDEPLPNVSPAGAGMHPWRHMRYRGHRSFPRRRGDAPEALTTAASGKMFPPQARGCTGRFPYEVAAHLVSPAGAGMHPVSGSSKRGERRFPRRRGDAPHGAPGGRRVLGFPPQARGCTGQRRSRLPPFGVSPAGAGMHRFTTRCAGNASGFPRRRGDAPDYHDRKLRGVWFPPQARGCTCLRRQAPHLGVVSPAGAGMHRNSAPSSPKTRSFPRRRGDAPDAATVLASFGTFPPQARGCTGVRRHARRPRGVSPAGAGMHRSTWRCSPTRRRFPRRRGDAPGATDRTGARPVFPPQARGCTGHHLRRGEAAVVSPAGAGMHLASTR